MDAYDRWHVDEARDQGAFAATFWHLDHVVTMLTVQSRDCVIHVPGIFEALPRPKESDIAEPLDGARPDTIGLDSIQPNAAFTGDSAKRRRAARACHHVNLVAKPDERTRVMPCVRSDAAVPGLGRKLEREKGDLHMRLRPMLSTNTADRRVPLAPLDSQADRRPWGL